MQDRDLVVGELYAYSRQRPPRRTLKVTVVRRAQDLPSSGKVLIRYEEGLHSGEEREVPLWAILAPWTEVPNGQVPSSTTLRPEVAMTNQRRRLDKVTWKRETGELQWQVIDIDVARGTASLKTTMFQQARTGSAPLAELTPVYEEPLPKVTVPLEEPGSAVDLARQSEPRGGSHERDERPARVTRAGLLVDELTFTPTVLESYQRQFTPGRSRKEAHAMLIAELTDRGELSRPRPRRGHRRVYARITVPDRFYVTVSEPGDLSTPRYVDELVPVRARSQRRSERRRIVPSKHK